MQGFGLRLVKPELTGPVSLRPITGAPVMSPCIRTLQACEGGNCCADCHHIGTHELNRHHLGCVAHVTLAGAA